MMTNAKCYRWARQITPTHSAWGRTALQAQPLKERDLGVHVDSLLKFRQQAAAAVAKGTQVLAVIRRSFALKNEATLPLLFKTLVRPHLEYGNLVWGPFNRADQKAVEGSATSHPDG